jgi:hypothetical protein
MKKFLSIILVAMLCGIAYSASAQSHRVTGTVIDGCDGSPMIGVAVSVKGTSIGVITDMDGKYEINVPEGSILVFAFVGYQTSEYNVLNQTTINHEMIVCDDFWEDYLY